MCIRDSPTCLDRLRIKISSSFFKRQLMTGLNRLSEFWGWDVGGKLIQNYFLRNFSSLEHKPKRIGPFARSGSTGFPFCVQISKFSNTILFPSFLTDSIRLCQSSCWIFRATSEGQKVFLEPRVWANSKSLNLINVFFVCKLVYFLWQVLYSIVFTNL